MRSPRAAPTSRFARAIPPAGGGYATRRLAHVELVFAAAHPSTPSAASRSPIPDAAIQQHRGVSIADTSRHLAPRTVGPW
jgi:hypothetical protein